jgi:tryptophan-rich sensory protein
LAKPTWRPPNRLFAPVWTVLYFTIAISGWLVWREAGVAGAALPLAIYVLQLVLNAAWTPIFFGRHRPDLGFLDIVLVWLSIIATIAFFSRSTQRQLCCSYLTWHGSPSPPCSTSLSGALTGRRGREAKGLTKI